MTADLLASSAAASPALASPPSPVCAAEYADRITALRAAMRRRGLSAIALASPEMDGGLLNLKRSAGMCAAAGVPVLKHSLGELGVAMAAAVHVIASTPNFRCANQGYGALLSDDIVRGPFAGPLENYTDGTLDVPEQAGLGVELDPEKMERYAELYLKSAGDFLFHDSGTASAAPALPKR